MTGSVFCDLATAALSTTVVVQYSSMIGSHTVNELIRLGRGVVDRTLCSCSQQGHGHLCALFPSYQWTISFASRCLRYGNWSVIVELGH